MSFIQVTSFSLDINNHNDIVWIPNPRHIFSSKGDLPLLVCGVIGCCLY